MRRLELKNLDGPDERAREEKAKQASSADELIAMKTVVSSRNAAVAPRAKATRSRTLVSKTNGALARRVACRAEADPKQAMEEQMKRLQAQGKPFYFPQPHFCLSF